MKHEVAYSRTAGRAAVVRHGPQGNTRTGNDLGDLVGAVGGITRPSNV
jgi:hypothetical protein